MTATINAPDYVKISIEKVIAATADDWKSEPKLHSELFEHLDGRLPKELLEMWAKIKRRLNV